MTTKRNLSRISFVMMLIATSSAHAGWYQIRNYVGTIGNLPVHVSLQTYDHIEGSYYYDDHRIPIPLHGARQSDGKIVLCEALEPVSFSVDPTVPEASPKHPVPCPITVKVEDGGAVGEWRDGKNLLPITLRQIASLDDTGDDSHPVDNFIEIPMWHHTKTHMLLGIYHASNDCPLSMVSLRLINIKTGQVDKNIAFDCGTGTIATTIYMNVYRAQNPRHVIVIEQGGYHNMGEDRDIAIEP